ncbi:DNA-binding transcriptional regulator, MarR family [Glycomyces sambucus]|uniref:DNA-binding transcriptional regulator, MarR family n=1 Tax=Glycomyces sambucus TaxID=380244 RepID=A0A1G9FN74_9ACTN|nr:MarR family transcriptional regulator [Glycomyces sambucus]SDK89805.1 DNA-binding transcriptional regulator, MarR family [Glycomyces sambucus]
MVEREAGDIAMLGRLLELTVILNADMERMFAREGLTQSRTHLLWLVHQDGPATQRHLAEALGVSARNVTGLVDAMVETGFVTREPHPTDRRATLVTLTGRGADTARSLERGQGEFAALLFGDLSEAERDRLGRGLDHVIDRLKAAVLAEEPQAPDDTRERP